jgi:hypothetical protein
VPRGRDGKALEEKKVRKLLYLAGAACFVCTGFTLGLLYSHTELSLAKSYNLEAAQMLIESIDLSVGAVELHQETADYLEEIDKLTTEAIDACLGRLEL